MVKTQPFVAALLVWAVSTAKTQDTPRQFYKLSEGFCCASETEGFRLSSDDVILQRLEVYRAMGFDMLRVEGLGSDIQAEDGRITGPANPSYLQIARASGFRLKVNINVLGQPEWYFRRHPQSHLVNEDGAHARGEISFWDPDTRPRVAAMTRQVLAYMAEHALFDHVDYIAPDFGPASEPIYPAAWTQTGSAKRAGESFWFYAPNAREDFVRMMAVRYGSVEAANARWGTTFPSWDQVVIPKPGMTPGPLWEDVLTWYRDSKREFIVWQIQNFQTQLAKYSQARGIKLLLYVPGTHSTQEEWRQAVITGGGAESIRLMCDSEFLLDTAARTGSVLQYTGCENEDEVKYLLGKLREKGRSIPLIGENAQEAASEPERIAQVILETGLSGIDYTHTDVMFDADGITPSDLLPRIKTILQRIKAGRE